MSGAATVTLENAHSRVRLAPGSGGAIAAFDALDGAGDGALRDGGSSGRAGTPVLKRASAADAFPFAHGCNLLLPFSNRIGGGGFTFDGVRHALEPNLAGEPHPIHGDAFLRPWEIESASATRARLRLDDGRFGPWRYRATVDYALVGRSLVARLEATHLGERPLPYGGGFHPWFPRDADTRIGFEATGVWLEDERFLPSAHRALADCPAWRFVPEAPPPAGWINNAFTGWTRRASVRQGPDLSIELEASAPLDVLLVHSPGRGSDFVCLEPVSHAVDAHNATGSPGLATLRTGETLALDMRITWG